MDSARTAISAALLAAWEGEGAVEVLRNRFVTGDWEEGQKRASAAPQGEDEEEAGEGEVRGGEGIMLPLFLQCLARFHNAAC